MNKEIKRQLILSIGLIFVILLTLTLWYQNFIFHTYIHTSNEQYCFQGENDEWMVQGYEIYTENQSQIYGHARLMVLKEQLLCKGDILTADFCYQDRQGQNYSFQHSYQVEMDNEVCILDEKRTDHFVQEEMINPRIKIIIERDRKMIYEEEIDMAVQPLTTYSGGNKDYLVQNVYVSDSWLKTGNFSSKVKNIENEYPYMTMDYLYLNENGDENDINDYERFAYLKGKTDQFLNHQLKETAFYDDEGSLLEKDLRCVISFYKSEDDKNPYTFMLNLHGAIKVVDSDGSN